MLDRAPDQLCERVANQVYEMRRTEKLRVVGFPSFNTVVNAIQTMCPDDSGKEFQVTMRKHDRLVVLQAYAQKWMESEFKDETTSLIEAHNAEFNKDGEFWHEHAERPVHVEKRYSSKILYAKYIQNIPKTWFPKNGSQTRFVPVRNPDAEEGRPHKRIKLEDSELAKEADVVTLQKPYLGHPNLQILAIQ